MSNCLLSLQIKSQLNMSTGEFQSLTDQLEDVDCLLTLLEKLVSLQVCSRNITCAMSDTCVCGTPKNITLMTQKRQENK